MLGAAGFVGRHTALALARRGYRVLGVGHGQWTDHEWHRWGLSGWLEADISIEALDRVTADEEPVSIVHCGGSGAVSFSYTNPFSDFERATQSTAAALEWIRLTGARRTRFVLVSSAAVYGDQGDFDVTENYLRAPISPYGVHKAAAEALCESYSRFFGVASSIVRLFSVYGEGLRKQLLWDALNKFRRGENQFFGTGNELRDWIHVDDAATLLTLASHKLQSTFEVFNGGAVHATTRQLLDGLACAYGHVGGIHFNGELHKGNPSRLTSDCGHATRLLNWAPQVKLENGLARYAAWFKSLPEAGGAGDRHD
ncbi:NAD-dependent epimerase/dehydratase family protein [Amphibiibacter pelophylacis]|uniref:NAD(P)-dependent oxidoreductase n=1 Tax=Amphibiibacter pelophylacis TaxID=1799477 RepID=A0ACC6P1Y4_9BURK